MRTDPVFTILKGLPTSVEDRDLMIGRCIVGDRGWSIIHGSQRSRPEQCVVVSHRGKVDVCQLPKNVRCLGTQYGPMSFDELHAQQARESAIAGKAEEV